MGRKALVVVMVLTGCDPSRGAGQVLEPCHEPPMMAMGDREPSTPILRIPEHLVDPAVFPFSVPLVCDPGRLYDTDYGIVCGQPTRPSDYPNRDLMVGAAAGLWEVRIAQGLHEPTLACGLRPDIDYLRLQYDPALPNPDYDNTRSVLRVECGADGGLLLVKRSMWRWNPRPESPEELQSWKAFTDYLEIGARRLDTRECDALFGLLEDADFWDQPSPAVQEQILRGYGWLDGQTMTLEGVRRGRYNAVFCKCDCPEPFPSLRKRMEAEILGTAAR